MLDNIKHKVNMENISRTRKRIRDLQKERFKLELSLLRPLAMAPYSLIKAYWRCGKKTCRCHKGGPLHGPYYYLTQHREGKTSNIYIPKKKLSKISIFAERYKEYETSLTKLRNLNKEILTLLKMIEKKAFVPPSKLKEKINGNRKKEY